MPVAALSNKIPATLIPGDGIGPEIVDATLRVLDALGAPFEWDVQQGGMAGVEASGDPLPQATLDSIRRTAPRAQGPARPRRSAAASARSTCGCARSSSSTPTCARRAR